MIQYEGMEILPITAESLSRAAGVLREGGLVAFPTETVYGLGADAFNPEALVKIFEAKGRPRFDPLIVHIADVKTLEDAADLSLLSDEIREKLFLLADRFWPGALSIVLPKSERIPGIATAGLSTVAVRLPGHEGARELIRLSGGAVAAPSANPFGALSPTRAEHVREGLGEKVDIILDGGPARIGVESTVLDITSGSIRILRPGGVSREEIEEAVGRIIMSNEQLAMSNEAAAASPGMLKSHYAPKTRLFVFGSGDIVKVPFEKDAGYLFFDNTSRDKWMKEKTPPLPKMIRTLSESGNASEAAACLFEALHEMDNSGFTRIYAQFAPCEGLGAAINDRLRRASAF
jgi:L-threonylcarbamoyladenylate synthase